MTPIYTNKLLKLLVDNPRSRHKFLILLSFLFIVFLIVGGTIGIILRIIYELKSSLEFFIHPWIVSPILFIGTLALIVLTIQTVPPILNKVKKKIFWIANKKRVNLPAPRNRRQAARQSLRSIDMLLENLHDNVAKQVLSRKKDRVAKELSRGDLLLVIFGSGSSGKTSLIRAMLNEIVGEVEARMGSTNKSAIYRLKLKGFTRGLQLIDTPGILEAGIDGFKREKRARSQAGRSDLMIIVLDNDLRESEYKVLKELKDLGKRMLVVLNKCDLRGEAEEKKLLNILRARLCDLISPADIIPISSAPQTIPRPGQRPYQPSPEIGLLLQRLTAVLHDEGEELLADNILLQCRSLGDSGRYLLGRQRLKQAQKCVERYSWITGGVVAATPLPGIDLLGTAAVNAQMVIEIGKVFGVTLTRTSAQDLALSVGRTIAGLGLVKGSLSIIGTALSLSIPTLILSRTVQGVAASWLTKIAGSSFITYFEQDQDWGDGGIEEVVQQNYDLNRRKLSMEKFLEIAIRRVVDPLSQKNTKLQLPPNLEPQEEGESWDPDYQEE